MSITPDELRQVRFAQTRKGYDTEAVDRVLAGVADGLEALLRERQQLAERVGELEAEIERYRGMEASLTETLALAERGAERVKAEARAEADRIIAEARAASAQQQQQVAPQDAGVMVELLGETRAIRSLLQAFLSQGGLGRPGQDP
jgi:cell division initiation protein